MDIWAVVIREACRHTMARYNHAGDRLLLDQMSETFTEDGVLELRGRPPIVGRTAIVGFIGGIGGSRGSHPPANPSGSTTAPRQFVRHNVASVHFESVSSTEVRAASYFTVITEIGLDHVGRYRDRLVPVGDEWLFAHRLVTTDWWAPESRFKAPGG